MQTSPLVSWRRRATLGLGLGLVLPFSALPSGALAEAPRRGGTLRMLIQPEPAALCTIATTAGAENRVSPKVHEGLLTYDFALNPLPQLATAWEVSADALEYRFTLRSGVRWHDGKPLTARDVATSVALLKEHHPRGRSTFANVREVRTPDPLTAIIVLSRPAPYLIYALAASESPIVADHLYGEGNPVTNPAQLRPIGTGPFRFREWRKGDYILYDRNPDYWDQPKPYLDQLLLKVLPDASARAAALETGELDIGPDTPVPFSDIARLKALPQLDIDTRGYDYTGGQSQLEFNLDNPILKNVTVRQAIAHAIDRRVILNTIRFGYGAISPTPIPPNQRFHAAVPTFPFDPKRAEALLDEAGYRRGQGGIRFTLTHDYNPFHPSTQQMAAYVRQALARIGISVSLRSQDFAAFVRRIYTDRDYDMAINLYSAMFDPTVGLQRAYWSKNIKRGLPFSNGSGYANPEVDRLLEAAAVEPDPAKRYALFREFQEIVGREVPMVTLVTHDQVTIFNRRVRDHTVDGLGLNGNLAGVWLAT
ncbi:ABC transporter substrate-binding protein [Paracraurococcus lichenis]|uniref:ABC transporter substrate-binding protein n=1 Tax=Paracraurococcus lichenis TaxID=3064888 RepID=A0ABT9E9N6_9PROT|nr:ABC transporter substrate-binding protein [Paracraurococcus sp. LOR1-02]MDO9712879.1 ABC transporter substrate-binding protein [Paracraurococcus sp. LOR1-02]